MPRSQTVGGPWDPNPRGGRCSFERPPPGHTSFSRSHRKLVSAEPRLAPARPAPRAPAGPHPILWPGHSLGLGGRGSWPAGGEVPWGQVQGGVCVPWGQVQGEGTGRVAGILMNTRVTGRPGHCLLATDHSCLESPAVREHRPGLGGPGPWCCCLHGECDPGHPCLQAGMLGPPATPGGHSHGRWDGRAAGRRTRRIQASCLGSATSSLPCLPRAGPAAKMRIQGVLWLSRLSQKQFHAGRPRGRWPWGGAGARPFHHLGPGPGRTALIG